MGASIDLTFSTVNWNIAQTVTVTAVSDSVTEGTHTSTITHTVVSADSDYNAFTIANVTAGVSDFISTTVFVVGGTPASPSADAQDVTADDSGSTQITLSGSGFLGSNPKYYIVTEPEHGTLTGDPPDVVYTGDPGYTGSDSFTYIVANGVMTSSLATVELEVVTAEGSANTNTAPTSDAGSNRTVAPGAEVFMSANESFDPDGDTLTYAWVQVSRPLVADRYDLAYPEAAWSFTAPQVASTTDYEFELTVTDSGTPVRTSTSHVLITVVVEPNEPPVAKAGPDQSMRPGDILTLSGVNSYDPDENLPLSFVWRQIEGPEIWSDSFEGESVEFEIPDFAEPTKLVFELSVTDSGVPPTTSKSLVELDVAANTTSAVMCGAGLPNAFFVSSCLLLVGMRRSRRAIKAALMMLAGWVVDARQGQTYDASRLGHRRAPRWKWSRHVMMRLDEWSTPTRVKTADISDGGIRLWLPEILEVGQSVQLCNGTWSTWLEGRVVHVVDEPNDAGFYSTGIDFATNFQAVNQSE